MRFLVLREPQNKIFLEWDIDRIIQSLKENLDKYILQNKVRFVIIKEPENKILYKREFVKGRILTLQNIGQFLQNAFQDTVEEFKSETIHIK